MNLKQLPPFAALRAFEAVGRLNGFRKAAAALNISHAIVSRHVSSLEQHLGAALIDRKTAELTAVGKDYHARISDAIAEMELATYAVRTAQRGQLTIWCSAGFALQWLTRRLPSFSARSDGVMVDLRSTDIEPSLVRGEADGDIRYQPDHLSRDTLSGHRVMELARPPVYPVASPQLLAGLGYAIREATDLQRCPLIEEGSDAEWTNWFSAQSATPVQRAAPVARYGQAHLTVAAARAGQGIALSNDFLIAEDLAEGRLVRVTPMEGLFRETTLGTYVFRATQARWHEPALIRFRTWLKTEVDR